MNHVTKIAPRRGYFEIFTVLFFTSVRQSSIYLIVELCCYSRVPCRIFPADRFVSSLFIIFPNSYHPLHCFISRCCFWLSICSPVTSLTLFTHFRNKPFTDIPVYPRFFFIPQAKAPLMRRRYNLIRGLFLR